MPSSKSKPVKDNEEGMQNVELHRAESMVKDPSEFPDLQEKPNKNDDLYSHVASTADSILSYVKELKIELVMFLYMFSYVIRSVSSTTMIMDKACLVHLAYSEEVCQNLKDHFDAKIAVEKLGNNYHLGHSLVQMVPSVILSSFIGAWSDRYGRKAPVIVALLGIIIDGLGSTFCAAYFYSRIEFYYIPALFTGCSGGFVSVLTVLYSYTSDITTFANRTMKYAFMEMAFGLAMPLGQLAGGWIFKWSGYVTVFLVSIGGHVATLAFVLFVLQETRGLDSKDSWATKFKNFWSIEPMVEGVKATFKKRPNRGREQILLLILAMSFSVLTFASTAGIGFFYVHNRYDWENTKYSTVVAVFSVIGTITMVVVVAICKRLKLGDPTLGIIGSISLLLKNIGIGLAMKEGVYYLANLCGLLSGLATLAGRSRISKVTSKDDLGKVFSFLTSAESVLPIIATAIVAQVFNATLVVYPGLIYLILGGSLILPVIVFIWVARLPTVDYEEMQNQSEEVEPSEKETKPEKF